MTHGKITSPISLVREVFFFIYDLNKPRNVQLKAENFHHFQNHKKVINRSILGNSDLLWRYITKNADIIFLIEPNYMVLRQMRM